MLRLLMVASITTALLTGQTVPAPAATTAPFFPLASAWWPPEWWPQAHTPALTASAPTTTMIPKRLIEPITCLRTAKPGSPPPFGLIPGS